MSSIKTYTKKLSLVVLVFLAIQFISCKKYLDEKPQQNLAIPSTLADLQALLDGIGNGNSSGYLELVTDNFYLDDALWASSEGVDTRKNYIWAQDANINSHYSVWFASYQGIYQANFALEFLPKISFNPSVEMAAYNNVKGMGLFTRAFLTYQLSQLFSKPYTNTAATDPGVVLRLTAAVEETSTRATVKEVYDKVIEDLKSAAELLPVIAAANTRPNKASAYGALARVYLSMRDYTNAELYADKALQLNPPLLDYNSLSAAFPRYLLNSEIQYFSYEGYGPNGYYGSPGCKVDSTLYTQYTTDDLRKTLFFQAVPGGVQFKGSYYPEAGTFIVFDGIATSELYLVRAECRARKGNKDLALDDLNTLLRKRWRTGTFNDLTAADAAAALDLVLTERRKELLFRGLRWSDLRRFNLEGANITLKRIINGTTYTLPPNDLRWVLLIPDLEISRSGLPQNPR